MPGLHPVCPAWGLQLPAWEWPWQWQQTRADHCGCGPPAPWEHVPEIGVQWLECEGPEAVMDHASLRAEQILTVSRQPLESPPQDASRSSPISSRPRSRASPAGGGDWLRRVLTLPLGPKAKRWGTLYQPRWSRCEIRETSRPGSHCPLGSPAWMWVAPGIGCGPPWSQAALKMLHDGPVPAHSLKKNATAMQLHGSQLLSSLLIMIMINNLY